MKKILYISNIEAPYRVEFFNELSKYCELTVLYERKESSNRSNIWKNKKEKKYSEIYLNGIKIRYESAIDFKIFKYIFDNKYDNIIFGCYNSVLQMISILTMRLFKRNYCLNLDGEIFINDNKIKDKLKKVILRGANKYLVAGEKSAESLQKIIKTNSIYPYYFTSLSKQELIKNSEKAKFNNREEHILIIGQYFEYKGLDIILEIAQMEKQLHFKIIGTGNRTEELLNKVHDLNIKNIEVISFLEKTKLAEEYLKCKLLVLPSKQECWGLVINEAASYGTPIVSTYGSGAAIEFLEDEYPFFLAKPNDIYDLDEKINNFLKFKNLSLFEEYLLNKSKKYTIENMVEMYRKALNI